MMVKYFFLFVSLLLLTGCQKDEDTPPSQQRTVLAYMVADNNLSGEALSNLDKMLAGFNGKGNFLVYVDLPKKDPELRKIVPGDDGKYKWEILQAYPERNSASGEVLKQVIQETMGFAPADSYGLILWSHGMGWLPDNYYFPGNVGWSRNARTLPLTKYFAEDKEDGITAQSHFMEILDLKNALVKKFDFILFDACLMASTEVLYELREKCDYMIASPLEVLAEGFPYDQIMPYFWEGKDDLLSICQKFMSYYGNKLGDWRSAAVSLIDMAEMERLAGITSEILRGKRAEVGNMSAAGIERYYTPSSPSVFYDLAEFIKTVATAEQYNAFAKQLEHVVIYKQSTDAFFQVPIPKDKFCGVSSYIPRSLWESMNDVYFTFDWSQTVYGL